MTTSVALLLTALSLVAPAGGAEGPGPSGFSPGTLVPSLSLAGPAGWAAPAPEGAPLFRRSLPRSMRGPPRVDGGTLVLQTVFGAAGWATLAIAGGGIGAFVGFPVILALGYVGAVVGMTAGVAHIGWRRGYDGKTWATLLISILGNALTMGLLYLGYVEDWPEGYIAAPLLSAAGALAGTIAIYHGTSGLRGPRRGCIRVWGQCL